MASEMLNSFRTAPDERGRFGDFGGRFVSETLMPLILDLEAEYERAKKDPSFWAEMDDLWKHYVGRPSPLYFAERLTEEFGGAKIYLKRDELNHTGAHKINNVLGQILLARRMGKTRIIAETRRRFARALGWSAWSLWAPMMLSGRPPMCSACACSGPKSCR